VRGASVCCAHRFAITWTVLAACPCRVPVRAALIITSCLTSPARVPGARLFWSGPRRREKGGARAKPYGRKGDTGNGDAGLDVGDGVVDIDGTLAAFARESAWLATLCREFAFPQCSASGVVGSWSGSNAASADPDEAAKRDKRRFRFTTAGGSSGSGTSAGGAGSASGASSGGGSSSGAGDKA
jgi:hypothetical protein